MIQFTELDVSMFSYQDHRVDLKEPLQEMVERQIEVYNELFRLFRKYKDIISGVTIWGVSDDRSWLNDFPVEGRKDWPLLFNENLQPKEVLKAITTW